MICLLLLDPLQRENKEENLVFINAWRIKKHVKEDGTSESE